MGTVVITSALKPGIARINIAGRTGRACNNKFNGDCKCGTPHHTKEAITARLLEAFNQLLPDREKLIDDFRTGQTAPTDCTNIDREIKALPQELEVVIGLTKRCVDENSTAAIDQDAYLSRYNGLAEHYNKAQARINALEKQLPKCMA